MTKKGWIIFSILCATLLGGLIFISQQDKVDVSSIDANIPQAAAAVSGDIADHTYGNMQSKVILIEYGDFQCPGCGSAHPVIKQVIEKYKDKIGFVFRNFPLTTIHPNAFAASAAVESAGLQGKYWEMHDKLYENQEAWKDLTGKERTDYFRTLALGVGVEGERWESSLDSVSVQKKINFDQALGQKVGVSGTPAFYLNGENIGDTYFEGDKLVESRTDSSRLIWSDATAFENLIIKPALEKYGTS